MALVTPKDGQSLLQFHNKHFLLQTQEYSDFTCEGEPGRPSVLVDFKSAEEEMLVVKLSKLCPSFGSARPLYDFEHEGTGFDCCAFVAPKVGEDWE